VGDLSLDG